jgi:hypothetical protein
MIGARPGRFRWPGAMEGMMYSTLDVWLGIILGGLAGAEALWLVLHQMAKVPFDKLGGHPGKLLWSVIYMVPVPLILAVAPAPLNWLIALVWLSVGPTAGTKFYFGPKTVKWGKTIAFNGIYAVVALVVYWVVVRAI